MPVGNENQNRLCHQFFQQQLYSGKERGTQRDAEGGGSWLRRKKTFDDFYISEENQAAIRQALADGKTVYRGCVNFECCEETQAELFERLWEALEDADPDTFSILDGDLDI